MNEETIQLIGLKAGDYFDSGFHCAEAIVAAVLTSEHDDVKAAISHASAFGGGFGKSFAESCGVLTGSLIVIGHRHGRQTPEESWDRAAELGAETRENFLTLHQTTNCGVLRERFGPEEQMARCRKLVIEGAVNLLYILNRETEG